MVVQYESMKKPAFSLFIFIFSILVVAFGVTFNRTYFPYIYTNHLSGIARMLLWVGQLVWLSALVALLFFHRSVFMHRRKIVIVAVAILAAILGIEAFLRIVDTRVIKYSPHQYLNYHGTPNYVSRDGKNIHNSLGFRGPEIVQPKPKNVYRVAVLGGSSAYEEAVTDWRNDFARQLEAELRNAYEYEHIEVINAGFPGWTTWEDLINFEFTVLDLEPDLIIPYVSANDVHTRFVRPDAYKADNSGMAKHWAYRPCLSIFCMKIVEILTAYEPLAFSVNPDTWGPTVSSGKSSVLGMSPMEALDRNPPIYTRRNLTNMIVIARQYTISVLLSTWAHSNLFRDYAATPHYERAFKELNDLIVDLGSQHDLPVFDFAAQMPVDKRFWADGRHNNEEGVRMKAMLFRQFITTHQIIDRDIAILKLQAQ